MGKAIASLKAVITRLVFACHGLLAIWQVASSKRNPAFWYLGCPIILLFFEGTFTLTIKANQEWKWFCPSVFLYLGSVVPAIWLLELDKVERRLRGANDTLELASAEEQLEQLRRSLGLDLRLPGVRIARETWVTLIEQFLMLVLIVGRWMLPKGELTRDQLSQLLLVYIGTAADIIEFFDSFKEERVARERLLVYLTLAIWSWSLLQFTVVLSATKSRRSRLPSGAPPQPAVAASAGCCGGIDLWAVAVNMILQDAPFLAFRLILIAHYRIVSYMNVFFTCKNSLVILLQLYRLHVVRGEARARRRAERRRRGAARDLGLLARPGSGRQSERQSERRRLRRPRREREPRSYRQSSPAPSDCSPSDSEPRSAVVEVVNAAIATGRSERRDVESGRCRGRSGRRGEGRDRGRSSEEESEDGAPSDSECERRPRYSRRRRRPGRD
ncbi:transmembrane protein 26 isoform X3 [Phymastichus coffea]|uniref:transmembrane protein 26 isoform X3 n=1 Tax=Phymastichus coffea TaxID=108790 RepID=UPI00273C2158|nr:transmembrane protein 26 isoform X3 [Phymastichus coffea]